MVGRRVENYQKLSDVIYGCSLITFFFPQEARDKNSEISAVSFFLDSFLKALFFQAIALALAGWLVAQYIHSAYR